MIRHFAHQFSCDGNYRQAIALWGCHSGRSRGTAKAPRSVISMYWKIIFRGFYEKMWGYNNTLPKMSMEKMHFFSAKKTMGNFPFLRLNRVLSRRCPGSCVCRNPVNYIQGNGLLRYILHSHIHRSPYFIFRNIEAE